MKTTKVLVTMPESLKAKLDALRIQGYTASGFIRAILERELGQTTSGQKGR
jgi:metal-responsive CopG/Arc/MetJ family transcriptional regulator